MDLLGNQSGKLTQVIQALVFEYGASRDDPRKILGWSVREIMFWWTMARDWNKAKGANQAEQQRILGSIGSGRRQFIAGG